MRWPLRYQILLPFALLLGLAIALTSALNAYWATRRTEARVETQLREIGRTLLNSSFPLTATVLRQTRGLSGAEFVATDAHGEPFASSFQDGTMPALEAPQPAKTKLPFGPREWVASEEYFHAAIDLAERTDRAEPGLLHILYPVRQWHEERWQAASPPLLVGGVALVAVVGVALALAARLSRPIQRLQAQVGRLAAGQFEALPLPERNDELRDLCASVNDLAGQLEELRRVIKRSERLALLGQLGGGLAHHLRNDVTGARLAIQLHERACPEQNDESLAVARRQLVLAEQHLQQFLTAGRPTAAQRIEVDLYNVMEDLLALVAPTCRHRGVTLDVCWLGNLATADTIPLQADPEQLRQALVNLALNAVEAAGPGGWVRLEAAERPRVLVLRVLDSGTGVPSALVERLFEPFTTSKPEGIGLGLTVARQVALAHGGTLVYRRDPHTCFELELPYASSEMHSPSPSAITVAP